MREGYVSSCVTNTSNLTRRSFVSFLTSGWGHVKIWTRCSCGVFYRGQWSRTCCFQWCITIPVAVSSLMYLDMNLWKGKEARLWVLTMLGHDTESWRTWASIFHLFARYSSIVLWWKLYYKDFWKVEVTRVPWITAWHILISGTVVLWVTITVVGIDGVFPILWIARVFASLSKQTFRCCLDDHRHVEDMISIVTWRSLPVGVFCQQCSRSRDVLAVPIAV